MTKKRIRWPPFIFPISLIPPDQISTSLELLRLPYVFSQTGLLSEWEFRREAKQRGVDLEKRQLEQLHRRGALVPLFRIHVRQVAEPLLRRPDHQEPGVAWHVYQASEKGRLRDPSQHPFAPWPRGPRAAGRLLFSRYQLLALRQLRPVLQQMTASRRGDNIEWSLPALAPRVVEALQSTRALAIALEALAPRYRPRIFGIIRSPSDHIHSFIDDTNPEPEREFLGIDPSLAVRQAKHLLGHLRTFDPMGNWHRVVRVGAPHRWEELRFDALLALEHRVAAEHFLLYYEDLTDWGHAPPLPPPSKRYYEPRHDRLRVDVRERSETLLDFRLTTTPAMVMAVEGDTEMIVVPRALEMMGVDEASGLIDVVNLKGVEGDVRLLARSVAVPRLAPEGYIGARVLRPLTAVFVAVDPEGDYATAAQCDQLREGIVEEILRSLPPSLRTSAMRADLSHLVRVRTWGTGGSFEFAHFSDHELGLAIRQLASQSSPPLRELKRALAKHRQHADNVETVWRNWYAPGLSKPRLAEALWPRLREKLLSPRRSKQLPIAQILNEAIELALHVRQVRELRTAEEDQAAG